MLTNLKPVLVICGIVILAVLLLVIKIKDHELKELAEKNKALVAQIDAQNMQIENWQEQGANLSKRLKAASIAAQKVARKESAEARETFYYPVSSVCTDAVKFATLKAIELSKK